MVNKQEKTRNNLFRKDKNICIPPYQVSLTACSAKGAASVWNNRYNCSYHFLNYITTWKELSSNTASHFITGQQGKGKR